MTAVRPYGSYTYQQKPAESAAPAAAGRRQSRSHASANDRTEIYHEVQQQESREQQPAASRQQAATVPASQQAARGWATPLGRRGQAS
jgi:hypothetical protein|eukprot:COSAG01_NODE_5410_length_4281_cov_1.817312_3_plen_88_part_00